MQVLMLEPDLDYLAERSARGVDRRDEVWEGVLHLAPQPTGNHLGFETELRDALKPIVHEHGLVAYQQAVVFDPARPTMNYRTPDVLVFELSALGRYGVSRDMAIVIEVLSPHDEARKKFPFYAERGIPEYWLVDPIAATVEVYELVDAAYRRVNADRDGKLVASRFGLTLQTIAGPKLRITKADGSTVDVVPFAL